METHYTWAGILALLILLGIIIKNRFKLTYIISNPLSIILISFFSFFGKYKYIDFHDFNNLLLLISFVIFIFSYCFGKKIKLNFIDKKILTLSTEVYIQPHFFISKRGHNIFLCCCFFYLILDLYVNSIIYGSLTTALIRFYSTNLINESFATYKNLLSFLFKVILGVLFVFRFWSNVCGGKNNQIILGAILLVLISIPRGSRGAAISPFVTLFIADIFSSRFYNIPLKKYFIQYASYIVIIVTCFFMLTAIRSVKFSSIEDLMTIVKATSIREGIDGYSDREDELIIRDTKLCFDTFGNKIDFLSPFYTFNSIAVSCIPRTIYSTKPVSFGLVINAIKEGKTNDINKPYKLYYPGAIDWAAGVAGEGWANGGIFGLIFYSILFGFISGKCAKFFFRLIICKNGVAILIALMFFQMSSCFIRGGLQSTFTPVLYSLILIFIILKIYNKYESLCHSCRLGKHKK